MTTIDSIDAAIAALYGGPTDGFVAARDAMAKQVRATGDRGLANDIKGLRKPTVAADALNRAIRHDPNALEELLAAVERLRVTQEAMLSGGADRDEPVDFAADQRAYRDAVDTVAGNASSNEIEVRAALEAAAVGGLAAELRAAAFATLPEPSGGFGPFAAGPGSLVPGRSARGTRAGRDAGGDGDGAGDETDGRSGPPGARRSSAAERRLAERVRRAAEQAVTTAEDELAEAEEAATAAADRVTELDEALADLERRIGDARSARDDAVATRAAAEASRTTIARLLEEARATLAGLPLPEGGQESG